MVAQALFANELDWIDQLRYQTVSGQPIPCDDPLRHKNFLCCPSSLAETADVQLLVQKPGTLVVTMPGAYHTGYNAGKPNIVIQKIFSRQHRI